MSSLATGLTACIVSSLAWTARRASIGEERHRLALVAAQEHRPRDRPGSEPIADLVDRGVEGAGTLSGERQGELDGTIILEVAEGDADERKSLMLDHRPGGLEQLSGGGEDRLGLGRRLEEGVRASRAGARR